MGRVSTLALVLVVAARSVSGIQFSELDLLDRSVSVSLMKNGQTNSTATADVIAEPPRPTWESVDAAHQLRIEACAPYVWNFTRKNVNAISLYFSSLEIGDDQLIVSALNGSSPQILLAAPLGVTTEPIRGTGVKIEFRPSQVGATGCKQAGKLPTVQLQSVGYEWPALAKENKCTETKVMKNAVCFKSDDATKYNKGRAVFRINVDGSSYCTGWLWGNKGHIITNHHCISTLSKAYKSDYEFEVQTPNCGDTSCDACKPDKFIRGQVTEIVRNRVVPKTRVTFINADPEMDVALLAIVDEPKFYVDRYGSLKFRKSGPKIGEAIYVPQHPRGGPKMIATQHHIRSGAATITAGLPATNNVGVRLDDILIAFSADAKPGSSGSPVLAVSDNLVVALLNSGSCSDSFGIPSYVLYNKLAQWVVNNDGWS